MAISGLLLRAGVGPESTVPLLILRGLSPAPQGVGVISARHSVSPVPLRRTVSQYGDQKSKGSPQ